MNQTKNLDPNRRARLIRLYYATRLFSMRELAKKFGMSKSGVSRIVNNQRRKEKNIEN
jgi:predicted DNA-binding protein YlxM (UPF0122 family)